MKFVFALSFILPYNERNINPKLLPGLSNVMF